LVQNFSPDLLFQIGKMLGQMPVDRPGRVDVPHALVARSHKPESFRVGVKRSGFARGATVETSLILRRGARSDREATEAQLEIVYHILNRRKKREVAQGHGIQSRPGRLETEGAETVDEPETELVERRDVHRRGVLVQEGMRLFGDLL